MATRSHIGKKQKDGTIKYIYCHWDGYPSHNGDILKKNYNTKSKVDALLELGDLKILDPEIHKCSAFSGDDSKARVVASFDDFHNGDVSYYYLFEKNKWRCFNSVGEEFGFLGFQNSLTYI